MNTKKLGVLLGLAMLFGSIHSCGIDGKAKRHSKAGLELGADETSDDMEPIEVGSSNTTPIVIDNDENQQNSKDTILVSQNSPLQSPSQMPAQIPVQIPIDNNIGIPASGQVKIKDVAYIGNGCPEGSVASDIATDFTALTLIFSKFVAEVGPTVSPVEKAKQCRINFNLEIPSGWQFTIFQVDYRGFADLDAGTAGLHSASYFFADTASIRRVKAVQKFTAPFEGDFESHHKIGFTSNLWSRCSVNQTLVLDTSLALEALSGKQAVLSLDSIDAEAHKQKFHLAWRRCAP